MLRTAAEPILEIERCNKPDEQTDEFARVRSLRLGEDSIKFSNMNDTTSGKIGTSCSTFVARNPMKTIVFSGPSISAAEVWRLAAVTHAPPIKRGDLTGVGHYDVIVIIDGEFGQNMSVSPKEILAALERGSTVIGASSMGALRASELDRFGMIGRGWVYERFRQSAIRQDADVALVYSPLDFKPLTVPIVDVEYWVEGASAKGLIQSSEMTLLLKAARRIFFADRTLERLMNSLRRIIGDHLLQSLLKFSGGTIPSVKSIDAMDAVRLSALLAERHRRS